MNYKTMNYQNQYMLKYDLNYLPEDAVEQALVQFHKVYPEFYATAIGATNDRKYVVIACEMPDGLFYFRVNANSVSHAYKTLKACAE